MNKIKLTSRLVLVLAILLGSAAIAQAGLYRVGPSDLPSPPGHGFPLWYQDFNGLALDICNPTSVDQLTPCLRAPAPGEPLPTLPFQFNSNWPAEQFWYSFSASNLDIPSPDGGIQGVLVEGAIEAAFAVDRPIPAPGEQVSFARIRIRFDAPVDGTYTVTHPYGVDILPASAGERVFFTEDIGIGANGDFSGALGGRIGPFLTPVGADGVTPLPPVTISGRRFLTDGATDVRVTGSPFFDPTGAVTNYAEVCVDHPGGLDGDTGTVGDSCVRTVLFSVIGMLHDGAIASPLSVPRASYSRNGTSAKVDVFANASAGPLSATPILSFSGTGLLGSYLMVSNSLGQSYGQAVPTDACTIPAQVMITNSSDNPPSSSFHPVLDEVTITGATYNFNARTLTVRATSSDKGHPGNINCEAIPVPVLSLDGFPVSPQPLPQPPPAIVVTQTSPDPLAPGDLSSTEILVEGLTVPPPAVTVLSNRGGSATLDTVTIAGAGSQAGAPVAVDDPAATEVGIGITIPVLANDSGTIDASTVRIVNNPILGTAVVNAQTGVVTYTPTGALVGQDTFTYTVRSAPAPNGLESNVATVTVTVGAAPGGPAPIAVNDGPFTVQVNSSLVFPSATLPSLTANDLPNGGTIDPGSIQIVDGSTTGGTVTVGAGGTVTYAAGTATGNFGFSYTVANTNGQRSTPASVSIAVLPATDTLTITQARFRSGRLRWDVAGTSTVPGPANIVEVRLVRTGALIGSVAVDAAGAWVLRAEPSNVIAVNGDQVRATSTAGGSATLAVQVRQ